MNSFTKKDPSYKVREKNECLGKTKRMLEPELQPERDAMNNTITGCRKNRPEMMGK